MEDVDLNGISEEIEDVSVQIQKLNELSEPVIEEYRALSKTTDTDEYIEGIGSKIEELQTDIKSFERRVQLMSSNKGMVFLTHKNINFDRSFLPGDSLAELQPITCFCPHQVHFSANIGTIISPVK